MNQKSSHPHLSSMQGPLPLTIGVTGHRDLREEDVPALKAHILQILEDLRTRYPHTPILLLSSLAAGADQLAARVALEFGAQLMVPLPMPREDFALTHPDESSRAAFEELLARAQNSFVVPTGDEVESSTQAPVAPAETNSLRFAMASAFIAAHSNLMLAFWDGETQLSLENRGGTAHTVQFRLQGAPDEYAPQRDILDAPDTGPLWHIVTPRNRQKLPENALTRHELLPEGRESEEFERVRERIEAFNQDAVRLDDKLKPAREQSRSWLLPTEQQQFLSPGARRLLEFYSIADSLALHFAALTHRTMARIFLCVFLAATCFNIFHSLPHGHHGSHGAPQSGHATQPPVLQQPATVTLPAQRGYLQVLADSDLVNAPLLLVAGGAATDSHGADAHGTPSGALSWRERLAQVPWFLVLSLAASAICTWVIYRPAQRGEYQNKHQDYRALAEGLRVQFFWDVSGIDESAADHYLNKQRGELGWIQNGLRIWHRLSIDLTPVSSEDLARGLDLTRKFWIQEQRKYFVGKAHREHHQLERDEGVIARLIGLSAAMVLALTLVLVLPLLMPSAPLEAAKHWIEAEWPHGITMLLIVLLAVSGGLLHGFNQQQARAEHAKQFGRMSVLFDNAAKRLENPNFSGDDAASRRLIRALGREALAENGDWVLLHRERPLEVPHAG